MVTEAHRFLHRQDPRSPALPRHCVLQGFGVSDTVYHDMYYGCVSVGRSLELWALQEWGDQSDVPVVVVHLTVTGELDFSGNCEPDAARGIFEAVRGRRSPRYGQRRRSSRTAASSDHGPGTNADEAAEARAASERAASAVSDSVGTGQGLVNRMNQIAAALEARHDARFLVVVDDLGSQLEDLLSTGQAAIHAQAQQVLQRRWLAVSNPTGALIMYLDRDHKLSHVIDVATPGVAWWHIDGPTSQEINEALRRIDARVPLGMDLDGGPFEGVVRALERCGELRSALGTVAKALQRDGAITLNGVLDLPPVDIAAADKVLAELDELVGLDELKAGLRGMKKAALARRHRLLSDGVAPDETSHLVFLGNPGTGKTTVARIVARLFHALGALRSADVKEASAKDIKSEYDGETLTNMQRLLKSALGGVLFLDEAQHFADKNDKKSREAMEALVPMAWNHRHELIIILAGYSAGMTGLMGMDEGMQRRFPHPDRWYEFHDYNAEQLWTVLQRNLTKRGLVLDPRAETPLRRLLTNRASRGGFGNAGGVENLVSAIQGLHDTRVEADDRLLTVEDLPAQVVQRPDELGEALAQLHAMTGLHAVKRTVQELHYELDWAELEQDDLPAAPRFRFVGPPGTGKTTVARLIGQLLYGMGLLNRKELVVTTGTKLMAGFVGQTATHVRTMFDKARGGVLFIDEAHGMNSNDSFAEDARRTLVDELTIPENRDTVVIIAGYKPEIDRLLQRDPGLTDRFPDELLFEHLSPAECVEVARELLGHGPRAFTADEAFFTALAEQARLAAQSPSFGNARWVNNRVAAAKRALKARVVPDRRSYDEAGRRRLIAADLGLPNGTDLAGAPAALPAPLPEFVPANTSLPVRLPESDGAAATDIRQIIDSVVHLLVTTSTEQAMGTAFAVSDDNVFVTNYHVIEAATEIEVLLGPNRDSAPGTVIAFDNDNDLALIAVFLPDDVAPIAPLPLGSSRALPPLHELIAIGNSQVRLGEEPRVVTARVGRNQELDDQGFETDGAIEEGFSGGPLWDPQQGCVVGIVVGGRGRGVKIAIRAENALALLETVGYRTEGYRTEEARDGAHRN